MGRRPGACYRAALAVVFAIALPCILAGCSPKQPGGPVLGGKPEGAKLAEVERAHMFAGEARSMLLARAPAGVPRVAVPEPLDADRLEAPAVLRQPDVEHIHAGLMGRTDAALEQYARGVRQRETNSAELAATQHSEARAPDLEARIRALKDQQAQDELGARMITSAERSRLRLQIATLEAQAGVVPGPSEARDRQIAEKERRLAALEEGVAAELNKLRDRHDSELRAAQAAWDEEMAAFGERALVAARERSQEQIQSRAALFRQSVGEFIAGLDNGRVSALSTGRAKRPAASGTPAKEADIRRSLHQAGLRVEQRLGKDARIAADLARQSDTRAAGRILGQGVTARAAGLLSDRPR